MKKRLLYRVFETWGSGEFRRNLWHNQINLNNNNVNGFSGTPSISIHIYYTQTHRIYYCFTIKKQNIRTPCIYCIQIEYLLQPGQYRSCYFEKGNFFLFFYPIVVLYILGTIYSNVEFIPQKRFCLIYLFNIINLGWPHIKKIF